MARVVGKTKRLSDMWSVPERRQRNDKEAFSYQRPNFIAYLQRQAATVEADAVGPWYLK
jgi:hypothetical protein